MTPILPSYLRGALVAGTGTPRPIHDPTTEAVVAHTCTDGLDFGAALDFARTEGGRALRAMTFAERGALLLAMSKAIHDHREDLVALAIQNGGNTRSDAKFDIDGATGTMAYYGKLGDDLGDRRFLLDDDEPIALARNPRFVGQHALVPRHGVAVHINAFNFPAWGFGEKAAVALLAGMPVLCKPATSTALVTARIFEILHESGVVPPGVVSLVAGGPGDLTDHLGPQDVLAFTGSSDTGTWLRTKAGLVERGVRINVEADSLNSAILGPDVQPDTAVWDLFVRETSKDMTQKAGQKCTAIRRIFVPRASLDAAREALIAEVQRTRVGDPSLSEVRMGPLATAQQRDDVTAGIAKLAASARFVHGDGGRGELVGVQDKGWFVGPTLLEAKGVADAGEVHRLEVFGPVQTLVPYSGDAEEACAGVALGTGGLVSSVYSDDKDFVTDAVLALAPYHGRLHLGHSKIAEHSPGPGTVLPQLVHGGPGRAGGGEELGSARGMSLYLQRCAVQGLKPLVAKILG
jgi:3,4-dehydroadipyl-CoA semialdehyde dehydrogenase